MSVPAIQPQAPILPETPPGTPIAPPFLTDLGNEPPLPPEIVAMLAGPAYQPSKPKNNPWFTFAAGTVLILAIFMFLAFLVMANS